MPRRERRIRPLQHRDPRSVSARHRCGYPVEPGPQHSDQPVRRRGSPYPFPHRDDGNQHFLQGVRIHGHHLRLTPQMRQRRVDGVHVHGTHRTQILGHDQIRIQLPQRTRVQPVQILSASHPGPDLGIDLGSRQPGGQRRGRDDATRPGLRRKVALEAHPDDIIARTEGEKDLSGRGKQRHNPHHPRLSAASPPHPVDSS